MPLLGSPCSGAVPQACSREMGHLEPGVAGLEGSMHHVCPKHLLAGVFEVISGCPLPVKDSLCEPGNSHVLVFSYRLWLTLRHLQNGIQHCPWPAVALSLT